MLNQAWNPPELLPCGELALWAGRENDFWVTEENHRRSQYRSLTVTSKSEGRWHLSVQNRPQDRHV